MVKALHITQWLSTRGASPFRMNQHLQRMHKQVSIWTNWNQASCTPWRLQPAMWLALEGAQTSLSQPVIQVKSCVFLEGHDTQCTYLPYKHKQSHETGYLLFSESVDINVTDIKSNRIWYIISGQQGSQYTCTVGNTSGTTTAGAQVSTPDLDPNTNYTIKCTATENSCITAEKTIKTGK